MFPHFFVSFISRFQSFCESKEREKRRKGRRESSFFLVSGLPLPSPPLFHKKYKKILSTQNELCLRVKVAHVAYDPTKRTKALLFSTSLVFCSLRFRFDVSVRANML